MSPQLYEDPDGAPFQFRPPWQPGASSYGMNIPGQPTGDSAWTQPDPAAFDTRSISSSGITGTGIPGPSAPKSDGKMTESAANVFARGPAKQPPPGVDDSPANYAGSGVDTALADRTPQPPPGFVPDTRADEAIARKEARTPPQMIGQRDLQGNLRPQDAVDPNDLKGKEKTGAKVGSWAQRLAMAVLAATKLAPAAMEIVHPEYSQQMGQYQAAQAQDTGLIKDIDASENAKSQAVYRQAEGQRQIEQAALNQAKADPHYGRVQVDPAYARENMPWIIPDANGQVWIDKAAENTLTKPIPPSKLVPIPAGGSLYDPEKGSVVATTPKPPVEGEIPLGPDRIAQINAAMTARYQVLHPGAPLPSHYIIPAIGTQKDFDRTDKLIEGEEKAFGTAQTAEQTKQLKAQTQGIAQQAQQQHRSDQSYQFNVNELNKVANPVDDLLLRFGRLEDTIAQGTPQADALIAPELLTVMAGGQGSGMRMNEAEIQRIVGGRSKWESLKAAINQWSLDPTSARSITPEQQRQIVALVGSVGAKLRAKQGLVTDARNKLLGTDDPNEHRRIVAGTQTALGAVDGQHEQVNNGMVTVQIPGQPEGHIPAANVAAFKARHPDAVVK